MKTLQIEKKDVDFSTFKLRKPSLADISGPVIDEDTAVLENGKPVLLYLKNAAASWGGEDFLTGLEKWDSGFRSNGLKVESRTFGFNPRVSMRSDCCRLASLSRDDVAANKKLMGWANSAERILMEHCPEIAGAQRKLLAEKVLPEWRMTDLFTSGIINKNYSIVYHRDAANFPTAWSAMAVFKKNVEGGRLVLPQFNMALECSDSCLVIFNGTDHFHGVTESRPVDPTREWYRYSVVFYPMKQMSNCLPMHEEFERVKMMRTARENKKLADRRAAAKNYGKK